MTDDAENEIVAGTETDEAVPDEAVPDEAVPDEEMSGSLAAALLSAGFDEDGTRSEADPEPGPVEESTDEIKTEVTSPKDTSPKDTSPKDTSSEDAVQSDDTSSDDPVQSADEPPEADQAARAEDDAPEADEDVGEEAGDDVEDDADLGIVPEPEPESPYDLPGGWYVIHSYSGYENKVKTNLATRTSSMHMEDKIFEVVIPMETVVEIKGGRKVEVEKKMFPGYILVRMYLDDDSWYAVRNTPGVTAFVGGGSKPTPLSRREVERFLGVKKEEEKKPPKFKPAWDVGETVRVVGGPFADFNGVIEDMNVDQQKVKVLVEIFGRDTPMELNFEDIQKQ